MEGKFKPQVLCFGYLVKRRNQVNWVLWLFWVGFLFAVKSKTRSGVLFWDCVCSISLASELGLGASLLVRGCWCRVWICSLGTGLKFENWWCLRVFVLFFFFFDFILIIFILSDKLWIDCRVIVMALSCSMVGFWENGRKGKKLWIVVLCFMLYWIETLTN